MKAVFLPVSLALIIFSSCLLSKPGNELRIGNEILCNNMRYLRCSFELNNPDLVLKDRIRGKGAGKKSAIEIIKNIDDVFLKVIDDHIAGDPMNGKMCWTNLSHKKIAEKMKAAGINISVTVVKKLLKKMGSKSVKSLKIWLLDPQKIVTSNLKK